MDHDTKRFRIAHLRFENVKNRDQNKNYEDLDHLFDQAVKKSRHKRIATYASKKQHATGPAYSSIRKTPRIVEQMKTSEVDTTLVNIGLQHQDVGQWRRSQFEYKKKLTAKPADRDGEESNTNFLPNLNIQSLNASSSDEDGTEEGSLLSDANIFDLPASPVRKTETQENKSELLRALLRFEKIAKDNHEQLSKNLPDASESTPHSPFQGMTTAGTESNQAALPDQSSLRPQDISPSPDDDQNPGVSEQQEPVRREYEGFEKQEEDLINRFFQEMEIPGPVSRTSPSGAGNEPESFDLGLISEKPFSADFDQSLYTGETGSESKSGDPWHGPDWDDPSADLIEENAFYAPFGLNDSDLWLLQDSEEGVEQSQESSTTDEPAQPIQQAETKSRQDSDSEQNAKRQKRREELKKRIDSQKQQNTISEAAERGRMAYATEKDAMESQPAALHSDIKSFRRALQDKSIQKALYVQLLGLVLFAVFVLVFRTQFNTASWVMAAILLIVLILTSDTSQQGTLIMLFLTLLLFLFIELYQIFVQDYALHIFDYLWFILTPICTMTSFAFFHDYRVWEHETAAPLRTAEISAERKSATDPSASEDRKKDGGDEDLLGSVPAYETIQSGTSRTETITKEPFMLTNPEYEPLFIRKEGGEDTRGPASPTESSETQEILQCLMNLENKQTHPETDAAIAEISLPETAPIETLPAEPEESPSPEISEQSPEEGIFVSAEDTQAVSPDNFEHQVQAGVREDEEDGEDDPHDHPIDHFESLTQPIQMIPPKADEDWRSSQERTPEDRDPDAQTDHPAHDNAWIATELSDLHINVNMNPSFRNESLTEQETVKFEQNYSFFFESDEDDDE